VLARDRQQFAVKAISQAQLDADQADLRVKRASAAQQAALVAKKTIRAPFGGRLGITTVNPGQYLNPGDAIVTLQTLNPIYVDFNLPQRQIGSLSLGQHISLSSDAFPGQTFGGKVTAINPKVDPSTRNLQLEATVANDKLQLLPGMFASVDVATGTTQHYLTLPQTAVTYNPYGSTVFVLKPGKAKDAKGNAELEAQQVFVTTGATRGDQIAVLSGITAGDHVVTSGGLKLTNGSPVIIDNSVQPANNPNPTPQED
jgi:membrane fusion protein (multidrug efflux system)